MKAAQSREVIHEASTLLPAKIAEAQQTFLNSLNETDGNEDGNDDDNGNAEGGLSNNAAYATAVLEVSLISSGCPLGDSQCSLIQVNNYNMNRMFFFLFIPLF